MQKIFLSEILDKLRNFNPNTQSINAFVGIDGYIDFIQKPVKSQTDSGPVYFDRIADFSDHLGRAAGKSAQIELITQEQKLGGNAPIMAEALGNLGVNSVCPGNFGKEHIHPAFEQMHKKVELLSVGDPAITNALEFNDGKIILSEVGPFKKQDWAYIKTTLGLEKIVQLMQPCTLTALVDWCNLPFSTDIWKGIRRDVLPKLRQNKRMFFFDTADPSRRTDSEIKEALDVIGEFVQYGEVTLGLNENETEKLYSSLCRIKRRKEENIPLIEKGKYIFRHIKADNLLIHPTERSISVNAEGVLERRGRIIRSPKISTGGGDNFNAGFCLGRLLGLDIEMSMITGMANSGAYVQNGKSPSYSELLEYIENWMNEIN